MNHNLCGETDLIIVGPLKRKNIEYLRCLRNLARGCFIQSGEITQDEQQKWFEGYLTKPGDYMFQAALREAPDDIIGFAALYGENVDERTAEFGRLVLDGQKAGGRGLGAEITRTVCSVGFDIMGLESIRLSVYADNVRAIKSYEKVGFKSDIIKMLLMKRDSGSYETKT